MDRGWPGLYPRGLEEAPWHVEVRRRENRAVSRSGIPRV